MTFISMLSCDFVFPVSDRHAGSLSVEETAVNVFCRISFAAEIGIMHLYANACFALTDVCYFILFIYFCFVQEI